MLWYLLRTTLWQVQDIDIDMLGTFCSRRIYMVVYFEKTGRTGLYGTHEQGLHIRFLQPHTMPYSPAVCRTRGFCR